MDKFNSRKSLGWHQNQAIKLMTRVAGPAFLRPELVEIVATTLVRCIMTEEELHLFLHRTKPTYWGRVVQVFYYLWREGAPWYSPTGGLVVACDNIKGKAVIALPVDDSRYITCVPVEAVMPDIKRFAAASGRIAGDGLDDEQVLISFAKLAVDNRLVRDFEASQHRKRLI